MRVRIRIKHNGKTVHQAQGTTDDWPGYVNAQVVEYHKLSLQEKIEQAGGLEEYLQSLPDIKEEH